LAAGVALTDASPENSESLEPLRHRVRSWCEAHVPPDWRATQLGASTEEYVAFQHWWLHELREGGLAVPHWPAAWGGGLSLPEQVVVHRELARADAPRLDMFLISLHHTPATLLAQGTEAQRQRHLPAILDGEVWCQGFSEPNAGSDLASLTTRAVRDGDHYVVNGQKVWSTMAHYADWCLLLARTDPSVPKRKGISYLLLDMHSDGVEVRPLQNAAGEWEFCEIFLTDVVVPVSHLVGQENDGWKVAQSTLGTERGTMVLEFAEHLRHGLSMLDDLCRTSELEVGRRAIDDPAIRESLAALHTEGEILSLLCDRTIDNLIRHGGVGPEASIIKLYYSELLRRVLTLAVEVDGLHSHVQTRRPMGSGCESGKWLLDFVFSWMWTISAGTNEILRTVIAERVLGLPRDPGLA
jgi:alkylation response protein AidB-like acyl-CoA dehydrogenase